MTRRPISKKTTSIITLLPSLLALAFVQTATARGEGFGEPKVRTITFQGLEQTEQITLENEMLLKPGDQFKSELFNQSLKNIRNLRIHRQVDGTANPHRDGSLDVVVSIKEKQTLLPFFRIRRGGGSTLMVLGMGDLNAFGRAVELLPMYENFNRDYHGGKLDFRIPQISSNKLVIEGSTGTTTRIHSRYRDNGSPEGTYFQETLSWRSMVEWPATELLVVAAGFEASRDRYSNRALSAEQRAANRQNSFAPPEDDLTVAPSVRLDFGKINYDDYRPQGMVVSLGADTLGAGVSAKQSDMTRGTLQLKAFSQPYESLDLATRFVAKVRHEGNPLSDCFLGGFGEVRGFLDERFHGPACWFANIEARQILYKHRWAVLQPTLFFDAGHTGKNLYDLGVGNFTSSPVSSGAGIRIVFPSLARLALRLDFAAFHRPSHSGESQLSLGSQQFF